MNLSLVSSEGGRGLVRSRSGRSGKTIDKNYIGSEMQIECKVQSAKMVKVWKFPYGVFYTLYNILRRVMSKEAQGFKKSQKHLQTVNPIALNAFVLI